MDQLIEFTNAHPILVTGLIAMALATIFYELRLRTGGLSGVSALQAVRLINDGGRVVDVREKTLFDSGHIVDAVNIPATELAGDNSARFKKAKSVILVCDNGVSSGKCVDPLRKAGLENAFSLKGGLAAWRNENLPIVSSVDDK